MVISAVSKSCSRIFSKAAGELVEGGAKFLGKNGIEIFAPQNAKSYDYIAGIGKKGKFHLYKFKDANGNVIQNYTRYVKDGGSYTDVVTDIGKVKIGDVNVITNLDRKTINGFINGQCSVDKFEHSSFLRTPDVGGKTSFQKSFMTMTPSGDFGGQEIFIQGQKSAGIKFKYDYNGKPVNIEYKNTKGLKLDLTEEEMQYLPLINRRWLLVNQNGSYSLLTQDFTTERVVEKIGLAQLIQERFYGIKENLLPKAKAVKQNDLIAVKVTGKTAEQLAQERGGMCIFAEAVPNGQVNVATDVAGGTDGIVILDRVAHEMKHESDFIKMNLGGGEAANEALKRIGKTLDEIVSRQSNERQFYDSNEFYNKCIKENGIFEKGTPEFEEAVKLYEMQYNGNLVEELTSLAQHDAMDFEGRAIKREKEQMEFFNFIATKVGNFMRQIFI